MCMCEKLSSLAFSASLTELLAQLADILGESSYDSDTSYDT